MFLELNCLATHRASNEGVYEFVIGIAVGARTIEEIADDLGALVH